MVDYAYPSSDTRRGRVQDGGNTSPNITAEAMTLGKVEMDKNNKFRIRKLTPEECWRLMDYNPDAFPKAEKECSNSQLYKQAGNGIVVNCLVAIFGQMIPGKEDFYKIDRNPKGEIR